MDSSRRGAATPDAWAEWDGRNVVAGEDGVTVRREDRPTYDRGRRATVDGDAPIVDVALSPCGDPYVLTAAGALFRYDPVQGVARRLACVWGATGEPRALCVTGETIYVAGTESASAGDAVSASDPAAGVVQAISRSRGQTRWVATDGVDPAVALARVDGQVYLLSDPGSRGTASFDLVCPDGTLEAVVTGLGQPDDLAADAEGRLWVLDELVGPAPEDDPEPLVRRFDASAIDPAAPTDATDSVVVAPAAFRIHGTGEPVTPACLAVGAGGTLLVGVDPDSRGQLALLAYRPADGGFERQPALEAGCRALAASPDADEPRAYAVSAAPSDGPSSGGATGGDRWTDLDGVLHVVDGGYRVRRDKSGVTAGRLVTRFAAGEEGVQWHRVELARTLAGSESEVRIRYAATEDQTPEPVSDGAWTDAPALETLSGLGATYADRLRVWGVADLADLADLAPAAVQSMVAVEELDVSVATVEDWQAAASSLLSGGEAAEAAVTVVDGIGPTYGARLAAGGVPDLEALVDTAAVAIARIASAGTLDVALSRAESWVRAARDQRPERIDYDDHLDWTTITPASPRDALLEDAWGRYLWIEIRLQGTTRQAPTVSSFHAEFPRETYLEHLPAIYRQDAAGAAFLERYLSLFERIFTDVEAATEGIGRYLDPRWIPAESDHLAWLGAFLGMDVDEAWPTPVARTFIERAPDLYRMRGTRRGLRTALSIYLDHVEPPTPDWDRATEREAARLDGLVEAGLLTDAEADRAREAHAELAASEPAPTITTLSWGNLSCAPASDAREYFERLVGCPQGLLVLVHPRVTAEHRRTLSGIVAAQTPAHASVRTVGLNRRVQLAGTCPGGESAQRGYHTYLGVNSTLTERQFALESAGLGEETVLDSHESDGQLDLGAQLGADAHLS